ncbi:MAG: t-SNARE [Benjaminiella poitrasii]|nr:MAG: t-SNARE [Benjaminiella poitrasii]
MSYSFTRDRTAEIRSNPDIENQYGYDRPSTGPMTGPILSNSNYNNVNPITTEHESYEMTEDLTTTQGFLKQIDRLKYDVDSINNSIDQIGNMHSNALSTLSEQQSKQIAQELEKIKAGTQQKNVYIKDRIQQLENSNSRLQMTDPNLNMRRSQIAALKKRFLDTIQRYQDVERNYQLKYRQRIERQIRIVKPNATEEEVDNIIDADDTPQIFAQSLMSMGRQGQSKAVLSEVQNRHDDIKHIEKTIIELHQLFMDMQMMVEQQGEVLTNVEQNAGETVDHLKQGNTSLTRAITLAKSTRAKKWCCFFLCIGICVMIAILVWWFGFNHVGVGGNNNNN